MARRIKENRHWAGICAGMTMALVYIEPITDNITANNKEATPLGISQSPPKQAGHDVLIGPPLGGQGGSEGGGRAKATKTKTSKEKKKEIGR